MNTARARVTAHLIAPRWPPRTAFRRKARSYPAVRETVGDPQVSEPEIPRDRPPAGRLPDGVELSVAVVFPGQGSQQAGAGLPWVDHPAWTAVRAAGEAT